MDAAVVQTEAGYTYRSGQTYMPFVGGRRRGERGEEDEKMRQGEIIGCLHLLQDCVGSRQHGHDAERAERDGVAAHGSGRPSSLTPLPHDHMNSYGIFERDREKRVPLDGPVG